MVLHERKENIKRTERKNILHFPEANQIACGDKLSV